MTVCADVVCRMATLWMHFFWASVLWLQKLLPSWDARHGTGLMHWSGGFGCLCATLALICLRSHVLRPENFATSQKASRERGREKASACLRAWGWQRVESKPPVDGGPEGQGHRTRFGCLLSVCGRAPLEPGGCGGMWGAVGGRKLPLILCRSSMGAGQLEARVRPAKTTLPSMP